MAVESLGKLLIYIGIVVIVLGAVFVLLGKAPWFGRLPGDIIIRREGYSIYIPLVTMILFSLVLTLIFNLIGRK